VPRLRSPRPLAPPSARLLLAACAVLSCAAAVAQTQSQTPPSTPLPATAPTGLDPFAPKLQTNPRQAQRLQRFTQTTAPMGPPTNLTPLTSGAGDTGFDATNSRAPGTQAQPLPPATSGASGLRLTPLDAQSALAANTEVDASTAPAQETASPYQTPPPSLTGGPPVALGPIRGLPKKRKAHEEIDDPYAPLGVHAGSFTLYPAVEFIGGYDTNPAQTTGGSGAKLYSVAPELQAQSNWSRHELKADLRGSYTGYSPEGTPSLNRPYFSGTVTGRVDVTKTTRIDLATRTLLSTDNPGSPNLQAGLAKLPIYVDYGGSAGVAHSFNRFELAVKGTAERTVYQDSTLTDGTTSSNKDRQYNLYGGALRGSYELLPGIKPYVEIAADARVHDLETDIYGYQRDSKGLTGSVGSSFLLTSVLTGDVSLGYTRRRYDDPRFDDLTGLIGNASLVWTADALNTVKFTATSTVGETSVPGSSGALYRDAGVQVDHAFQRWLIGTVKLGLGLDTYMGSSALAIPDREDKRYSAALGLTYKFNRSLQLKGEIQQYWLRSNVAGNNYDATLFLLGLRLQR
jgi:hypothetical protein